MQRRMSPFQDIKSLFKLIRVLKKERPTIVHSITPKAGLLSMMAAKITGVPVRLHTFTGLVFPTATGLTKKILITTDRLTCACATHIMPEGEGVKSDLIKFNITKKPLKVLGYGNIRGIDLSHFSRNAEVMTHAEKIIRPEKFTFIFIGRLVADKGINELTATFSRLNREFPDTRLLLVGPHEKDIDPLRHDTLEEINTNDAIEYVGMQNDVRPWLAASDCFVFPSYREGFPNVVIEAGAMDLPSIVTDINGSREIISDGENGIIIPARDEESLLKAMRTMICDTETRVKMKHNARKMIASRFEQSFVRQELKKYYKEILSEK